MIAIKLMGGLGNMMFQIAAMESLARNDVRYDYKANFVDQARGGRQHVYRYAQIFQNFQFDVNAHADFPNSQEIQVPFEYAPLARVEGATYTGYFQSEKFMDTEITRHIFDWSAVVRQEVDAWCEDRGQARGLANACAVHVRRGDYLNFPSIHPIQSADYYQEAVKILAPEQVLVFSDDPHWCRHHLDFGVDWRIVDVADYMAMALMSCCGSSVISNSSFSWWGAWLADGPTVAPLNWFGPDAPVSARDILPERWIKL